MKIRLNTIGFLSFAIILSAIGVLILFRVNAATSKPYQIVQEIRSIDDYKSLTLNDFHSRIHAICDDYDTDIFKVYADIWDTMDSADPLYDFAATTLSYSVDQLYWEIMQAEDAPCTGFKAQKSVIDDDELNYLKNTLTDEEFINQEYDKYPPTSLTVYYDYNVYYHINDSDITVAERDKALNNVADLIQNYVDKINDKNYHALSIEHELAELLAASTIQTSDDKIELTAGDAVLEIY